MKKEEIEKLALKDFIPEVNKKGETKTIVVGQKNPHGFRKFCHGYTKGFRKAQFLFQQNWISVKEKLPEIGQRVICFQNFGENHTDFYATEWSEENLKSYKEECVKKWIPFVEP